MNEFLQALDSLACLSLQRMTHCLPPFECRANFKSVNFTLAIVFWLGSHPMLTRAKVNIFKTHYLPNPSFLGSFDLLLALFAFTEPKGGLGTHLILSNLILFPSQILLKQKYFQTNQYNFLN